MDRNIVDVLTQRGFVSQCTDEAMRERMAEPRSVYIGFDPTADSLHVGSLVPIMGLAWLQRCGHRPVALVGGATGLVGDPSGKTEARRMLTRDDVAVYSAAIGAQIGKLVRFGDGPTDARLVNNADWLADKHWIELLREVGTCFSVNRMLTMESVRGRMDSGGITFLEFNYMVMQAYDFLHLYRTEGCTVQMGGQDQWGNIVMGIELGRRLEQTSLAGLTFPLVTKADGGKFGKSEQGNVWLSAARTPVYDFYQFWRNVADADVRRFLCLFTFLEIEEIDQLTEAGGKALNTAKERLAYEATALIHGEAAAQQAQGDARRAFGGAGDLGGQTIPHAPLDGAELAAGIGLLDLGRRAGLWASNGEGRRLVAGGGVRLHERKIDDPRYTVTLDDLHENCVILRAGKKRVFRFDV
ncbi:MAG: tyrosine--tRNA ligase [Planctomycetota bacterium]